MKAHTRSSLAALAAPALLAALSALPATAAAAEAPSNRPQVVIAIGNSESMDGDLTGAIMAGSGQLPADRASLYSSSSPQTYKVPAGFTPPLDAGSNGVAPYTVVRNGGLYDNSASRLNIAKAGIAAVVRNYLDSIDFALAAYKGDDTGAYDSWVYYLPPDAKGFVFTNQPASGKRYVANPCYQFEAASTAKTVAANCRAIALSYGKDDTKLLDGSRYLEIGISSDDHDVNDVMLHRPGIPAVIENYGKTIPPTPYPPNFKIHDYNKNKVKLGYERSVPVGFAMSMTPTNAGYIPYSPRALFVQRGFGYVVNAAPDTAATEVPMTDGAGQIDKTMAPFVAALAPETNDPGNSRTGEIKAMAVQSPLAGLVQGAGQLFGKGPFGDCPGRELIVVTDGLPTEDLSGDYWPPLGSAAGQGYAIHAGFYGIAGDAAHGIVDEGNNMPAGAVPGQIDLSSTNDQALIDTIERIQALRKQGIRTFIVGMGAGVDERANPAAYAVLTAMAIAGGTGHEYPANSAQAFDDAVQVIAARIKSCELPPPPLGSVYFPYDRYVILPNYRDNHAHILAHFKYMQAHPQAHAVLQGNCDARGSREYNLALGQKRAEVVMKALEKMGIAASRMEAVSYGKEHPRAQGSSQAAWAENRRTDVYYPDSSNTAAQAVPLN